MMISPLLTVILALSAAVAWGSGDFIGGLAARRAGPFHAVLAIYSVGLLALIITALSRLEKLPPPIDLMWGALSGLSGMIGLIFLLRGFAAGRMGVVAPVSAVLATAMPVMFAAVTEGLPRELQLAGFGLAVVSIWMLARPERIGGQPAGLGPALLAGLGFGGFFIALSRVSEGAVFWPLSAGRLAACLGMVAYSLYTRQPVIPPRLPVWLLALAGTLDVGGNLLFLLAVQSGRLDVAAVLGSLYPAVTALLAWLIARETLGSLQMIGVGAAVLAIIMITL